ncbi:hypothetical protein HF324_29650 [Chitinophaga oryzae]|uniref:Uncharacterized protein n=1 Tax=Chitinophaga oryzae TaxID=2725414 RepID=A0AAE6ZM32_9BACT|nr:hypothetical protein [Chitinophaga oryzae]QJB35249.1 hypothetical protein HF329_29675 [Chitinophaga oryzae]QJB41784.1 hypothetical protein HF324_29650 [Chitinophaga oryzae]
MEMQDEQTNGLRENRYRPMGELIRGIFFILFGLFAIFAQKLGLGEFRISPQWMLVLGIVLMLYGIFRVYNGIRKLFFNRN